jgi:hypothetical protein
MLPPTGRVERAKHHPMSLPMENDIARRTLHLRGELQLLRD